jgi:hypothetical protein
MLAEKAPYLILAACSVVRYGSGARLHTSATNRTDFHPYLLDANLLVEYARSVLFRVASGLAPPFNAPQGWLSADGLSSILVVSFAPLASIVLIAMGAFIAVTLKSRHGWSLFLLSVAGIFVSLLPALNSLRLVPAGAFEYRYTLAAHVMGAVVLADVALRVLRVARASVAFRVLALILMSGYLSWAVIVTLGTSTAWRSPLGYWQRMTELYPTSYAALYRAGKLEQQDSNHRQAIAYLERALAANLHNDLQVHRRLGESYYKLGDNAGAREHWRIYYTENPYEITAKMRRRFQRIELEILEQ